MIRAWLVAMVLIVALTGCQRAPADEGEFHLNQAFVLAGGKDAVITGESLRLHFDEVLEDSRCAAQVECKWAGQARIAIVAQDEVRTPETLTFNTNPARDQNVETAQVGDYVINLLSLDPYPQTPEHATPLEQYRATLEVRKNAS